MQIPFHKPYITDDEINAAVKAIKSGWLTMGPKTYEFEDKFSEYIGIKNSIALNSGTAALHLALKAIGLQENDEVIIPSNTFAATAEAVLYFKAKPVIVDIERDTHLIDVNKIEENINKNTRAIIPVHYGGQPCDMDEIISLAKDNDLKVIEDAAHSLPAKYKNQNIGTIGDLTCFSFYVTKTISTGEGGMVTTNHDDYSEKIKLWRLHGISKHAWNRYSIKGSWQYDVEDIGYKYNTTDINSAIGIEQLSKIDFLTGKRKSIVERYDEAFSNNELIIKYKIKEDRESAYHLYPVKLNLELLKISRDEVIEELKEAGICTSVHFIPLYRFSYYKQHGFSIENYPGNEWVFERVISLPIYPSLNEIEVNYIIEKILSILDRNKR